MILGFYLNGQEEVNRSVFEHNSADDKQEYDKWIDRCEEMIRQFKASEAEHEISR